MSTEQFARRIDQILRRLDALEARSAINYVTSTYTPTYLGGSTAGTTTYTTQAGFYTRIGRVVFFNGRIVWTNATGTGAAIVSLPLTSQNTTDMRYAIALRGNGVTFANGNLVGLIGPSATAFSMESLLTNAVPTQVTVEAAGDLIFSGWINVG